MGSEQDFESLRSEVLQDKDARAAALENSLRQRIGAALESARLERGLSLRQLGGEIGSSLSQVQRLLHREVGGSLTLRTICRAADHLGLSVSMDLQKSSLKPLKAVEARKVTGWKSISIETIQPQTMRLRSRRPPSVAFRSIAGAAWKNSLSA